MASGSYDHPSFLTRQVIGLGVSTAGANGTSGGRAFISNMRFRKYAATVRTAGTSSGAGNSALILCIGTCFTGYNSTSITTNTGTTTIGTLALGSSVAYTVSTSTDMNVMVQAGSVLVMKNGTDATGVYDVTLEGYLDPGPNTSWTGPNN